MPRRVDAPGRHQIDGGGKIVRAPAARPRDRELAVVDRAAVEADDGVIRLEPAEEVEDAVAGDDLLGRLDRPRVAGGDDDVVGHRAIPEVQDEGPKVSAD